MTIRDWKWIVSTLSGIIVLMLSYKFWGKSGNLTEIISIGSGLVSIALAVTAIIISVAEGVKTSRKEEKVDGALDSIIVNLSNMKELINKVDIDNFKTHDKLSRISEKIEDYRKFYNEPQEAEVKPEEESPEVKPQEKSPEVKQTMKTFTITRGDVFLADFSSVAESGLPVFRPVVVIQNEIGNKFSHTITVAPLSTNMQKAKLPIHVEIDAKESKLSRDSVIRIEQVRTISKTLLQKKISHLDENIMKKVDDALMLQLGLGEF